MAARSVIPESLLANGSLDLLGFLNVAGSLELTSSHAVEATPRSSAMTSLGTNRGIGNFAAAAHLSVRPARDFAALGRDLRRQGEGSGRE
jgi:hypothetical protein